MRVYVQVSVAMPFQRPGGVYPGASAFTLRRRGAETIGALSPSLEAKTSSDHVYLEPLPVLHFNPPLPLYASAKSLEGLRDGPRDYSPCE
ncbi:hypothetical protein SKAU_G00006720 [Synaphobranchus kaupii]|uniref:Uncharacterized protein n=1 Tax=Synaphobranchus kaupii TaxID=118154 RepID=A0A9Q1G966_SYNKA|nr:hypothetical protein SKAU_G00006720 [Synaphobranchus kaupii]